eukprot:7311063-Pyramimonas_sp.AAC.3
MPITSAIHSYCARDSHASSPLASASPRSQQRTHTHPSVLIRSPSVHQRRDCALVHHHPLVDHLVAAPHHGPLRPGLRAVPSRPPQ